MQHFDIATVRATTLSADEALARLSSDIDAIPLDPTGFLPVSVEDSFLPEDGFVVHAEPLPFMSREERRQQLKLTSKARSVSRRQARAHKRARAISHLI